MIELIPLERVGSRIFLIRGQKVMLDKDLAALYGVPTKRLNEQVKRNKRRFPEDFMFQLSWEEAKLLRSHFATLKPGQHIKYLPLAFTEQGIAMLSSVLNSERAIDVNILIMRAFVKLRQVLATHKDLAQKFRELESRVAGHDSDIKAIFRAIRMMLKEEEKPKRKFGFQV
ncbi:ORF6N domain-containing protein [Candidatus Saganbacteria bacterium]|nr:ORF6N domain-containing protein [Candidatus Saganbacteria bacterium]